MIRVSVLYPNSSGAKFDFEYYCTRHMPLVRQLLGSALKGLAVDQGIGTPDSPALYIGSCHLLFDSVQAFESAFGPHEAALVADIPNFTNTEPAIQISEIRKG